MIEHRLGVTDWDHLIDTVVKNSSIEIARDTCAKMMADCLELCIEIYKDNRLAGYALIIDISGWRSFHGYKLIEGNSITAFRIARNIMKSHGGLSITTTTDKKMVVRLAQLLGLNEKVEKGKVVILRKNA